MNNRKIYTFIAALLCSMCLHALPTQFQYCYDCSRVPDYPKVLDPTTIKGFKNPYVGYNGTRTDEGPDLGNVPEGPWKLEYVENFDPENDKYDMNVMDRSRNQIRNILDAYYGIAKYWRESDFTEEIKAIARTIPVFELKQWNPATDAFEHAAYGVVLTYANESNVEHAALFVAAYYDWGCFLTDQEHSWERNNMTISISFDEDANVGVSSLVPETNDEETGIETAMSALIGTGSTSLVINRTLYKDGYFNTLCLPFSLTASELAESPLAGCELFSFVSATNNNGTLDINIAPETEITAGVPYLIRWESGEDLTSLTFNNIVVTTSTGLEVGTGDVTFVGTIGRSTLPYGNQSYLFVGAENTLYWSAVNDNTSMKGFRAYFRINGGEQIVIPRNSPARLVVQSNVATGLGEVPNDQVPSNKVLRDGVLYIMHNGLRYNVQGQAVK